MIAELPATFDEYLSSLGTSTRRNLRLYENRLSRAFPGFTSDTLVRGDAIPETADLFLGWKNVRFEKHGRSTYWQTDPHKYPNFVELVHRCGEARRQSGAQDRRAPPARAEGPVDPGPKPTGDALRGASPSRIAGLWKVLFAYEQSQPSIDH